MNLEKFSPQEILKEHAGNILKREASLEEVNWFLLQLQARALEKDLEECWAVIIQALAALHYPTWPTQATLFLFLQMGEQRLRKSLAQLASDYDLTVANHQGGQEVVITQKGYRPCPYPAPAEYWDISRLN